MSNYCLFLESVTSVFRFQVYYSVITLVSQLCFRSVQEEKEVVSLNDITILGSYQLEKEVNFEAAF
jgi:hypothetical protein